MLSCQVEELRSKGFEPYAYTWDRTHTANQLQELYKHLGNGEESNADTDCVSVAGRIVARRAFGKLAFLTLRDDSGTIQVRTLACFTHICSLLPRPLKSLLGSVKLGVHRKY